MATDQEILIAAREVEAARVRVGELNVAHALARRAEEAAKRDVAEKGSAKDQAQIELTRVQQDLLTLLKGV